MPKLNWLKFDWPFAAVLLVMVGLYFYTPAPQLLDSVDRVIDGVVMFDITNKDGKTPLGMGTGFFIGENLIITNNHVAESGNFKVFTHDSAKAWEARLIAKDAPSDIALVELLDWENFKKTTKFSILEIDENIKVGDRVYSVGHPWGYYWSVSEGIVSGVERTTGTTFVPLLQTDAKVYSGNSGGPLVNAKGKVVGMNQSLYAPDGTGSYGFSIPGEIINKVWKDMLDDIKHDVRWASVGIKLNYDSEGRVVVEELVKDGAAIDSGMQVGDVVLSITTPKTGILGRKVNKFTDVRYELMEVMAGEPVTLEIKRGDTISRILIEPKTISSVEMVAP